ncbi:hypothetical protein PTTG_11968 [Puccinia triticina 1-1 BBBD Race 1]|uniref:Uncharacterized protein n=2 Tax=Puccinia triticina TaxID=208348 RepID=A0A180GUX2_PUCT1|nr:uncharacterized protein PtA15_1A810 [Puccinia triticina]OAV96606.1 hypothetical protein PTTG_11968 [Puccinia triticina 1-1 BBBD Race 1]WAQ81468.1 hypothetical protein PtA15_1A810 [Puccinia triticina]WAR52350.1 hypothetical protein PtB15_1B791 [Puccinia triticina]
MTRLCLLFLALLSYRDVIAPNTEIFKAPINPGRETLSEGRNSKFAVGRGPSSDVKTSVLNSNWSEGGPRKNIVPLELDDFASKGLQHPEFPGAHLDEYMQTTAPKVITISRPNKIACPHNSVPAYSYHHGQRGVTTVWMYEGFVPIDSEAYLDYTKRLRQHQALHDYQPAKKDGITLPSKEEFNNYVHKVAQGLVNPEAEQVNMVHKEAQGLVKPQAEQVNIAEQKTPLAGNKASEHHISATQSSSKPNFEQQNRQSTAGPSQRRNNSPGKATRDRMKARGQFRYTAPHNIQYHGYNTQYHGYNTQYHGYNTQYHGYVPRN